MDLSEQGLPCDGDDTGWRWHGVAAHAHAVARRRRREMVLRVCRKRWQRRPFLSSFFIIFHFSSFLHHFLLCFELQGGGKATLTLQGPGLTIDGEVRVLAAFSELSTKQEFTPGFCILNGNSRRSSYRERERESTNDRWRW